MSCAFGHTTFSWYNSHIWVYYIQLIQQSHLGILHSADTTVTFGHTTFSWYNSHIWAYYIQLIQQSHLQKVKSGQTKDIICGRHGDNNCSYHIAEQNWASSAISCHSPSVLNFWGCNGHHHLLCGHSLVHTWCVWPVHVPWKGNWILSLNHVFRSVDGLSCLGVWMACLV